MEEQKLDETQELKGKKSGKWIILAIVLVALIAIGIVCFITLGNTPEKRFRKQMDLGNQYLEALEYEKAVAAFEAAIEIDPNNADAYIGLAKAYLGLGDLEKARKAFNKAIKLNPDYEKEYADLAKKLGLDQDTEDDKKEKDEEQTVASSDPEESDLTSGEEDSSKKDDKDKIVALEEEMDIETYEPLYAKGGVVFVAHDGKGGAMDIHGNLIVPCEYNWYSRVSDTGYFTMGDDTQIVVFSPKGEVIEVFNGQGGIATSSEVYLIWDYSNNIVTYKTYDKKIIYQADIGSGSCTPFCEGKAIVNISNWSDSVYGCYVITKEGASKIECDAFYEEASSAISNGMCIATTNDDDHRRILLVSWDGKAVGGICLANAILDKNGKLNCRLKSKKTDTNYWLENNTYLLGLEELEYNEDDWAIDGVDYREYEKDGCQAYNYGSKMVLISRGKDILVDLAKLDQGLNFPIYDYIGINDEKYWLVGTDGKWGYCDHDGNIIKLYDDAARFKNGRAFIIEDGTVYLIDENFSIVKEVGKGTRVYARESLFCYEDADDVTHYYVCTEEELLAQ